MTLMSRPDSEGSNSPKIDSGNSLSLLKIVTLARELLDEKEAAAHIEVKEGTLSVWRCTGRYNLPFIKIGRKVRYRRSDLDAWLVSRTRINGATA